MKEGYCWNVRERDEVRAGNNGDERMKDAGEPSGKKEIRTGSSGARIQCAFQYAIEVLCITIYY